MTIKIPPWPEAARLAALRRYDMPDTVAGAALDEFAQLAAELFEAPIGVVTFVDRDHQCLKAAVGWAAEAPPLDESFFRRAVLEDGVLVVPDLSVDPTFRGNALVQGPPHLRFYACALLKTAEGLPIGALSVFDTRPRTANGFQRRSLGMLGDQAIVRLAAVLARRRWGGSERVSDILLTLDHAWCFTYVNREAERVFGISWQKLVGREIGILAEGASDDRLVRQLRGALSAGKPTRFDVFLEGGRAWLDLTIEPTPDGFSVHGHDTTSRRREQFKLFERAASSFDDMVVVADADQHDDPRIAFVNEAFERRTGYMRSDIIGKSPRVLQGPKTSRVELNRIRKAIEQRQSVHAELINYTRQGEEFWLELDIKPVSNDYGWHTYWVAVQRDITMRKREEMLRRSETKILGLISSGVNLAKVLEEIALAVDEVSPGIRCSILLLDADGIHIRHGAAPHLPETYNNAVDGLEIGPATGSCGTAMYRRQPVIVTDIETDPLWADYRDLARSYGLRACWSTPVFDSNAAVIGTFALYWDEPKGPDQQDLHLISHFAYLAAVAIERIRNDEALRLSEERFRIVAQVAADVVWTWDIRTGTIWWNDGIRTLFGYDPRTLPKGAESWTGKIHPEDRERVLAGFSIAWQGTDTHWSDEYRFMRADGSVARVTDRAIVIRDESGAATRMIGSMVDVTEQRLMEDQLRQAQRLDVVGQLTGGIAHDFNNLLTVILGNAEMLVERLTDDERLRMLAQMTATAASQGAELTNRLLAFSRRQSLDPRATDVNRLVAGMEALLRRTLGAHIEFSIVQGEGMKAAHIDTPQLESAILNLCLNARDAMPERGRLTIETSDELLDAAYAARHREVTPGQYVMIAVSDTGSGMDSETLERAFEPFFTTKEVGKGSGLGLSMVYGFVRQSHGHIRIDSAPGQGTTVRLYLPATDMHAHVEDRSSAEGAAPEGTEKILLVEDNELVRSHVSALLRSLGYQVVSVRDGREALYALDEADDFDLLFTDVVMPGGMNGLELADTARKARPNLPVLFTSGYSEDAIVRGDRLGGDAQILFKPYHRQALAEKLRGVLDRPAGPARLDKAAD